MPTRFVRVVDVGTEATSWLSGGVEHACVLLNNVYNGTNASAYVDYISATINNSHSTVVSAMNASLLSMPSMPSLFSTWPLLFSWWVPLLPPVPMESRACAVAALLFLGARELYVSVVVRRLVARHGV